MSALRNSWGFSLAVRSSVVWCRDAAQRGQQLLQLGPRVEQARFHRVDRTVHDRCDLLTRISQLVAQLNGHPLLDRQVRQRLQQPVAELLCLHWLVTCEWLKQGLKVL